MKTLRIFRMNILHQIRTVEFWIPIIFILCVVSWIVEPVKSSVSMLDYNINAGFISFLGTNSIFLFVFFLGEIILFSKLPFKNSHQYFLISRTGKSSWINSHLLYIIVISFLYTIIVLITSLLFLSQYIYFDLDNWGKVINTFSESQVNVSITSMVFIKQVINELSPIVAIIYFSFTLIAIGYVLGCIQFLLNLITRYSIGNIISAVLLFIYLFSLFASGYIFVWLSPISWSNYQLLGICNSYYPPMSFAIFALMLLCVILTFICVSVGKLKTKSILI